MKIAKILTTCFKRGRVREKTELLGDPVGYFCHSQNFTTTKDTIDLLNFQIKMEEKYPPGLERDLIIVNSDVGSKDGNDLIFASKSLHPIELILPKKNMWGIEFFFNIKSISSSSIFLRYFEFSEIEFI